MEAFVKAYAKLNLTLDVTGRAPDGYHDMLMIMQGASLCDDVTVKVVRGAGEISVSSGLPYVPSDGRNIAAKAARAFLDYCGIKDCDVSIDIKKRIPVCAGLGGGSSDAAAVLRALNGLFGTGLSAEALREMSLPLGSDVPYCVAFGTMLAEGRGEVLTPLCELPECPVVICKPRFSISTPALFRELDCQGVRLHPDTDGARAAIERGDVQALGGKLENIFERVLGSRKAEICAVKEALRSNGALGAVMSGTGSAVFGLFDSERTALRAENVLVGRWNDIFRCKLIKGMEI